MSPYNDNSSSSGRSERYEGHSREPHLSPNRTVKHQASGSPVHYDPRKIFTDEEWSRIKNAFIEIIESLSHKKINHAIAKVIESIGDFIGAGVRRIDANTQIKLLKMLLIAKSKSVDTTWIRLHSVAGELPYSSLEGPTDPYQLLKAIGDLPSPSETALEIYRVGNKPTSSKKDIASVIKRDPAISSKIIFVANSAYYKQEGRDITLIEDAFINIGQKMTTAIAFGVTLIHGARNGPCEAFNYDLFWSESLALAISARYIADCKSKHALQWLDPEEAFLVGLFCQIGRLAFATVKPLEYSRVINGVGPYDVKKLLQKEKETFGLDHNDLAARMMADWGLPDLFCDAVRHQQSPEFYQDLPPESPECEIADTLEGPWTECMLGWTGRMASIMNAPEVRHKRIVLETALKEAHQLGLSEKRFGQQFDAMSDDWRETGSILTISTQLYPCWDDLYSRAG